ncbi:MAG TPA: hypothetical protein VMS55_08955 [Myxococcota bacterium]|nr:hypothetical protein [Myxococcota bacterium]
MASGSTPRTVARFLIRSAVLAALAILAWRILSIELRLGVRSAIRGVTALAAPLLVGGYFYVFHRRSLHGTGLAAATVGFACGFVVGALTMAALRFHLALYPIPAAELGLATCAALSAFGSGTPAPSGIAAGAIASFALFGVPRLVHI